MPRFFFEVEGALLLTVGAVACLAVAGFVATGFTDAVAVVFFACGGTEGLACTVPFKRCIA